MSPFGFNAVSERLFRILVITASVTTMQAASSPATTIHTSMPVYWAQATATTTKNSPSINSAASIEKAINDLIVAKSILSIHSELKDDPAFEQYLNTIDNALSFCENKQLDGPTLATVGDHLRGAAFSLQAEVNSLQAWLTIYKIINPVVDDYISVPDRFVSIHEYEYSADPLPDTMDLAVWKALDSIEA